MLALLGLLAYEFGNTLSGTVIASIVASIVAGVVSYLTKRSGDQATVKVAETTTRGDIEQAAFERAEKFLQNTIDRQDAEIAEQAAEIAALKTEVIDLGQKVDHYRRVAQRLARAVYALRDSPDAKNVTDRVLDQAVMDMLADEDRD